MRNDQRFAARSSPFAPLTRSRPSFQSKKRRFFRPLPFFLPLIRTTRSRSFLSSNKQARGDDISQRVNRVFLSSTPRGRGSKNHPWIRPTAITLRGRYSWTTNCRPRAGRFVSNLLREELARYSKSKVR